MIFASRVVTWDIFDPPFRLVLLECDRGRDPSLLTDSPRVGRGLIFPLARFSHL
jgi:hypothetical protein